MRMNRAKDLHFSGLGINPNRGNLRAEHYWAFTVPPMTA